MKRSTLTLSTAALALLTGGMLVPETAQAYKPKSEWKHVVMFDPNDPGHVMTQNYIRRKRDRGSKLSQSDIVGLYEFVNIICQVGKGVATFIPEPHVLIGAGVACVATELARLGLPPTPPLNVYAPNKNVKLDVYLSDPKIQKMLEKHGYKKVEPPKPDEPKPREKVPTAKVPEPEEKKEATAPKPAENAAPVQTDASPKAKSQPVAPAKAEPPKQPAKPASPNGAPLQEAKTAPAITFLNRKSFVQE